MGFLLLLLLLLSHVITLWCYNVMVLVHSQCAPLKDFLKILWPDQFSNVPHFFYFFKLCRVPNISKQNVTKIFVFYFICWRRIIIFCWPLCQGATLDSPSKTSNLSEKKTKWLRNDLLLLTFPRHIFGKFNPNPGDDSTFALNVESSPDPRTGYPSNNKKAMPRKETEWF